MIQREVLVSFALLSVLSGTTISCEQGKAPGSGDVAAANKVTGEESRHNTPQRPWPGAYPEPISLKGLRRVALSVYADRGVPSGRISLGPFDEEIQRRAAQ